MVKEKLVKREKLKKVAETLNKRRNLQIASAFYSLYRPDSNSELVGVVHGKC